MEILDDEDRPLPPGERGEVTLTGGFNFCLPLLRYRTGDHAALDFSGPEPVLVGLQGRPPVRYRTTSGSWINNIEITHALRPLALPQWTMHQAADGTVTFRHAGMDSLNTDLRQVLQLLLGDGLRVHVEQQAFLDGKVIQYTSDLTDPATT